MPGAASRKLSLFTYPRVIGTIPAILTDKALNCDQYFIEGAVLAYTHFTANAVLGESSPCLADAFEEGRKVHVYETLCNRKALDAGKDIYTFPATSGRT